MIVRVVGSSAAAVGAAHDDALEELGRVKGEQVVAVMDRLLFERGGAPAKIRVDNGPEFISRALDHWAYIN